MTLKSTTGERCLRSCAVPKSEGAARALEPMGRETCGSPVLAEHYVLAVHYMGLVAVVSHFRSAPSTAADNSAATRAW